MEYFNEMTIKFKAASENESFARACVASFCLPLNPSYEEITDIKTAVSEAVTNSVVHAYPKDAGDIVINVRLLNKTIYITIKDFGIGIDNIEQAKEPFYTTKKDNERSGMGFTVMESFMDNVEIESTYGAGTIIKMVKIISGVSSAVGG